MHSIPGKLSRRSPAVKYFLPFPAMFLSCLAVWVLQIQQFFCTTIACPPPDFPDMGAYEPKKAEYKVGEKIMYTCNNGRTPIFVEDNWVGAYKILTCITSGKWSEGTPFCDIPIQIWLRNTSLSLEERFRDITSDINPNTCFRIQYGEEEFLEYSLGRKAIVHTTGVCYGQGSGSFKIQVSEFLNTTFFGNFGTQESGCVYSNYHNKDQETENITVQVSTYNKNSFLFCEVLVLAKTDRWCMSPPEISAPNGQLEVSRGKAVLHCNDGFRERDGREVYATCSNYTWSYSNLQCVGEKEFSGHLKTIRKFCASVAGNISLAEGEWDNDRNSSEYEVGTVRTLKCKPGYHSEGMPLAVTCQENGTWTGTTAACKIDKSQKDYKILGIAGGSLFAIVIIILIGVKLFFLLRKRSKGMPLILKRFGCKRRSISPSVGDQSILSSSEA